ncbi:AAA domain-containing protein [Mesorhizobium sp.]|uniref:AAA domain-containing protein n=1 Tax=Mesorhizobium sp. TaxID=1871066 RepID=UPI00257C86B0|nr:AAA domain-containing protein [Mesorhizobium sp.]
MRLLEPFRTFVEEDERRNRVQPGHRPIAATLTEQRRMDPAIAEVVSKAFYKGTLRTEERRARAAVEEAPPFVHLGAMPVVVDFPHVSSTGRSDALERSRPRWHNPSEVAAVIDVLRQVRAREGSEQPSLAILTPYKVQAKKLHERLDALRRQELKHLDDFKAIRSNGDFIGTVDSFQGGEADLMILSLVRNNAMAGGRALGFLRDSRRMNVALSRAKSQLILVGSLDFLRETVRGVNPDNETHDLSFLTEVVAAITALRDTTRNGLPLASFLKPDALRQRV